MKTLSLLLGMILISPSLSAHPAWGIAVDDKGNIFFADIFHNQRGSVWKLDTDGELHLLLSDFHAHNVDLDADGNLYSAHGEGSHTLLKISPGGERDTLFHSMNHKEFFGGNCTFSPKGEIIFGIEGHLWKINENGEKEKLSPHKFEWNQAIYADEEGNYYGTEIGDGKGSIIKIGQKGRSMVLACELISQLDRPYDPHADVLLGMTRDSMDDFYVAETAGQRIIRIAAGGKDISTYYRSEGHWLPTAITFGLGHAYIMECKTKGGLEGPRIIRIDARGQKQLVFDYQSQAGKSFHNEDEDQGFPLRYISLLGLLLALGIILILGKNPISFKKI